MALFQEKRPSTPPSNAAHPDLIHILEIIRTEDFGNDIQLYSYEAEKVSGDSEVTVFLDKWVAAIPEVVFTSAALDLINARLRLFALNKDDLGREVAMSTNFDTHFLPMLDLDVQGPRSLLNLLDRDGREGFEARSFYREMCPLVFDSGNSLHLYGSRSLEQSRFGKFCGEALLKLGPVIDKRFVYHSLVRGEFHFRISHLTGEKLQLPCRNLDAEELANDILKLHQKEDADNAQEMNERIISSLS